MIPLLSAFVGLAGLLGLIWIGYPLIMHVAARLVGDDIQADRVSASSRMVSVVVATRDSLEVVVARIGNLLETDHPGTLLEIIVARDFDCQSDWTTNSALADSRVRMVAGDRPGGKASTLNAGVRAARGEIVVLADSAQRFDQRTIPELVAALEDDRFGAVSGALVLGDPSSLSPVNLYWNLEKWLRHNESRVHSSVGVTGAVYAIRRSLWPQLPETLLLDDVYVPMSLVLRGHRIGFRYQARAWDVRTFASGAEGRRKVRTLTGVLQLLSLLPAVLDRSNPIRFQFIAHKLARLLTPVLVLFLLLDIAVAVLLLSWTFPLPAVGVLLASTLVLVFAPRLRQRVVNGARWQFEMQRAICLALYNAFRGNWSVWASSEVKP